MALMRNLSSSHMCKVRNFHAHHWQPVTRYISCHSGSLECSKDLQQWYTEDEKTNSIYQRMGIPTHFQVLNLRQVSAGDHASVFRQQRNHILNSCIRKQLLKHNSTIPACFCKRSYSTDSGEHSDSEEVKLVLEVVAPTKPAPVHVDIVPGKGPPPEPPVDCCMSGCANCVWIQYAEELKSYFTEDQGLHKAKEAIEQIENPGLKMFLKLELGLL